MSNPGLDLQSLLAQLQAMNSQRPMSEQPPVPIAGLPGSLPELLARLPSAASRIGSGAGLPNAASSGLPSGARVGHPAPNIGNAPPQGGLSGLPASGTEKPGFPSSLGIFAPVSGPAPQPLSFPTKSARTASAIQSGIQGLQSGVMAFKQKQFQDNMQRAKVAMMGQFESEKIVAHSSDPKAKDLFDQIKQKGLTPELKKQLDSLTDSATKMAIEKYAQTMSDPKTHKMFDKATNDPNSAFYFGVQAAYKEAQGQAMQEAQMEALKAQLEQIKARSAYEQQEAAERKARAALEEQQAASLKDKTEHPEKYAKPGKEIFSRETDPKTGLFIHKRWNAEKGEWEVTKDPTPGTSSGGIGSKQTRTDRLDPNTGLPVHTIERHKIFPGANAPEPGTPGSPVKKPAMASPPHTSGQTTLDKKIDAGVKFAFETGTLPKERELIPYVTSRMAEYGFDLGQPIPQEAKRRYAAAAPLVTPSPTFEGRDLIGQIEYKVNTMPPDLQKRMGTLWSNFDFFKGDVLGTTGIREYDELLGLFKSAYALGGGVHGWRGYKAPDELQKALGDIRRGKDNLLDGMKTLRSSAELAVFLGTHSPGHGNLPTPGAAQPTPALPEGVKIRDYTDLGKKP